ncbi:MAG TPA: DUF456 domain-containing protein [bacterium]|nr:DUF456 domain-containing protein [bacterium]HPN46116.1 DUF456 domain-containing protein [bacterium]
MTIFLVIIGLIVSLVGLAGCIVPFIPGPPLSFLALIILSLAKEWQPFSVEFLIIWAVITIFVSVFDNIAPVLGAKKYGASKTGVWLSVAGMLIGLMFFPPWGIIIGTFLGAFAGELISGKKKDHALKAGWGVFVGTLVGVGLKLAASAVMLFYYIIKMF